MIRAWVEKHELVFKTPARTSRNTLNVKKLWLLKLQDTKGVVGVGEISPFPGLSVDDRPDFEDRLEGTLKEINNGTAIEELELSDWPSIAFGMESALLDLANGGKRVFFPGPFAEGKAGIPINGLIWMASREEMLKQVEDKIAAGFRCIKMKIGFLDFDEECRMLEAIRRKYSAFQIELRVDANGAFPASDAMTLLKELARFQLHSIEQPIAPRQWDSMAKLCRESPLAIALDEELLGVDPFKGGSTLLKELKPSYLILKPGLLGGFKRSSEWIRLAEKANTPWWITSALESNIGLEAIAQYTATFDNPLPQGLGTGMLYENNFASGLVIRNGELWTGGT